MAQNTTSLYALSGADLFRLAVYVMLTLVVMLPFVVTRPRRVPRKTPREKPRPRDVRCQLLRPLLNRLEAGTARLDPHSPEFLFCSGHLAAARHYASAGEFGAAHWSALAVARKLRRLR